MRRPGWQHALAHADEPRTQEDRWVNI